jgi:3-methylfumaryl-CoA hydratase
VRDFRAWIGRSEEARDIAAKGPLERLAALLDHESWPWPADQVPPLGHWLYFLPRPRQSAIGRDGHPERGGFIPPLPYPRRMWAGGRLEFLSAFGIGAPVERRSTITELSTKRGATGAFAIVTIRHELRQHAETCIVEEQDLIFRAAEDRIAARPAVSAVAGPIQADFMRGIEPDPTLLFRYSALTFNSHRIHYDRDYARDEEGYPGLVVQAPLIATLLMDHFMRATPDTAVRRFTFRAVRPLFDHSPFDLCLSRTADGGRLWTLDESGQTTMTAEVVAH